MAKHIMASFFFIFFSPLSPTTVPFYNLINSLSSNLILIILLEGVDTMDNIV